MTTKKSDTPSVDLNLDKLEREGAPRPFSFVLGGKHVTAQDPMEMDWKDAAKVEAAFGSGDYESALQIILGDEFEKVSDERLPGWKLNRLITSVMEHYGQTLGDPGESPASDG